MPETGDLYMRRTLSDSRILDWSAAAAKSPDIIPYLFSTPSNPQEFFSANYSKDVGKPLIVDEPNHIYVRAKNMGTGPAGGSIRLYYAESSMVLFPSMWQNNLLRTASGGEAAKIATTEPQAIGVGKEPFVWSPPLPPANFHYCFVGLALTDDGPPVIPRIRGIRDLAAWNEQGRLTSRNIFFVNASAAAASVETRYEQGDTEEKIDFTIVCKNCPLKASSIQFTSTSQPPIKIPKTLITQEGQINGVSSVVPAGLKTTFKIDYFSDEPPAKDWQIDFTASMKVPPTDPLFKHARTVEEMGLKGATHLADPAGGPVKIVTLGTATLKNTSPLVLL